MAEEPEAEAPSDECPAEVAEGPSNEVPPGETVAPPIWFPEAVPDAPADGVAPPPPLLVRIPWKTLFESNLKDSISFKWGPSTVGIRYDT